MIMNTAGFVAVFVLVFLSIHVVLSANYVPSDKIFLNCGGPPETTDSDGLKWTSDVGSKFASGGNSSTTSAAATQDPSVPDVPFMTARVFRSEFTYKFPVASGRKFIRLYFYPASMPASMPPMLFLLSLLSPTLFSRTSVLLRRLRLWIMFILPKSFLSMSMARRWMFRLHPLPGLRMRLHL